MIDRGIDFTLINGDRVRIIRRPDGRVCSYLIYVDDDGCTIFAVVGHRGASLDVLVRRLRELGPRSLAQYPPTDEEGREGDGRT
jgi:hypothetical protein